MIFNNMDLSQRFHRKFGNATQVMVHYFQSFMTIFQYMNVKV